MALQILDIIEQKKRGGALEQAQIQQFIDAYVRDELPDYQVSALLMAIWFAGMNAQETVWLTQAMAASGEMVDLSAIPGVKVDKHSTGGVADTTTLVMSPMVAACGLPVVKMSGRGLGHTGGTVDKLESIPGVAAELPMERFLRIAGATGMVVAGQSANLAPADKKLYALRDVTATVDSLPLIASSVMSKKLAAGCDAIVLDVKCGTGAFMPDVQSARELARVMVKLGLGANRRTVAVISNMDQPLGRMVGNALEVREALEILRGQHSRGRLLELSYILGEQMLILGGLAKDAASARAQLRTALQSGLAYQKLMEMLREMGAGAEFLQTGALPEARFAFAVNSDHSGYIGGMNASALGHAALCLGAGRLRKEDSIDPAVGLEIRVSIGDHVQKGDVLATIYTNDETKWLQARDIIKNAMIFQAQKPADVPLVYDMID